MAPLGAAIDLSSEHCRARVHAHGAHLIEWAPAGESAVLWLSPLARFDSTRAIRGGVPIVFPWFGGGRTGAMAPSHGFARLSGWQVEEVEHTDAGATASFHLDSSFASSPMFPHRYDAHYLVRAGEHLALELTVTNTGPTPFSFEEVLHSYLAVSDIHAVTVEGLDGAEYVDKVAGPSTPLPVQSGGITFGTEVDRVYRSAAAVRVVDPLLRRTLVIEKTGSHSTVVWNPGASRAAQRATADIGAEHWGEFVCVEGGNVQQDAVTLEPDEASTMTYALRVERLA